MKAFGMRLLVLLWCVMAARAELPLVWTVRTAPVPNPLNGVAFCHGIFLAVGSGATILTSPEGIHWTTRSAGTNTAALFCVAYGNGRYVLAGGEAHAVILTSTDGVNWCNATAPPSAGAIHGMTYDQSQFVAVGRGAEVNTSCILTSSNGLDWVARPVPTPYALYDVSPPAAEDGLGWADYLYIAVGDHGTILTSSNGVNWVLRNSGTTAPLRNIAWQGGLLAGGDFGTLLSSSDGFSWTPAAPASFNVRGLASSFGEGAVVAVGNYTTSGRLQASVDGLSWPGNALQFPQPLNAVCYGGNSFVAVGDGGLILQAAMGTLGVTNEWTKVGSGNWEEPYWSLGVLPSADQQTVAFRNPGWKALAISANTRASYPNSLTVNNLIVEAPTDSANQLLLNWAGLDVPLTVLSNLIIGTNGSLVSHSSALRAANAYIDGVASFLDDATEDFGQLWLRSGGTVNLTNGSMTTSNLTFSYGTFTQSGGSHIAQNVDLPVPLSFYLEGNGTYYLQGGAFTSKRLNLGFPSLSGLEGFGVLVQTGGVHTNSAMELRGYFSPHGGSSAGRYLLQGGLLISDSITSDGGYYNQTDGTNIVQQLNFLRGGSFVLSGGELVTSNSVVFPDIFVAGRFTQTGGKHIVRDRLLVQGGFYENPFNPEYTLSGGSVVASNLQISGATLSISSNAVLSTSRIDLGAHLYVSSHGIVSNTGIIAISGKPNATFYDWPNMEFADAAETQHLGQLQIFSGAVLEGSGAAVLRFADSHTIPWTGPLRIRSPGPGSFPRLFFGTNALGLTAAQLAQTQFETRSGNDEIKYAAMLLPTGELVPAVPPPLAFTKTGNSLILSWPGPYELLTSTNVLGPYELIPGATSPVTNDCSDTERYFRLTTPVQ